jgi:hypothetical protein
MTRKLNQETFLDEHKERKRQKNKLHSEMMKVKKRKTEIIY